MNNNYNSLSAAYADMRKQDEKWVKLIKNNAYDLRDAVFSKYAPEKSHWNDEEGKKRDPYVYLFSLNQGPEIPLGQLPNECIKPGYELVFGLAIVLENLAHDNQRLFYCAATVAQYQADKCCFKRLDSEGNLISGENWFYDHNAYADYFLQSVLNRLKFNPFSGEKPPNQIGFLR